MLKTWELSYFKSPGRRLFFVTPRAWTDEVLPLTIAGARIERAMIGRVELMTPAQHACLARVAAGPCPDIDALTQARNEALRRYFDAEPKTGKRPRWDEVTFADLHVPVSPVYQAYLDLGRFRDALVLREQQQRPTAALAAFIDANSLQGK